MRGKRRPGFNIELGLAVSALSLPPGQTRSQRDLAAFCGCSKSTIQWIEKQAMQKVRKQLEPHLE